MKPRSRYLKIVVDRKAALILLALVILVGGAGLLSSQQLTMTATYPIPAGVYNQIVTTGNSGSAAADTTLNRNAGNTILVPPTNSGGRVGIGTTAPLTALDVGGSVRFGAGQGGQLWAGSGNYGGKEAVLTVADGGGGANDEIWIGPNTSGYQGHVSLNADQLALNAPSGVSASNSLQIGDSSLACAASSAGSLRWHGGNLEICDGASWHAVGGSGYTGACVVQMARVGSSHNTGGCWGTGQFWGGTSVTCKNGKTPNCATAGASAWVYDGTMNCLCP